MKIIDVTKSSLRALTSNKMRSILTMLGIIIGIMSVILIMSIGEGARGYILNQIESMGATTISIEPGAVSTKGPPDMMMGINLTTLRYKDVEAIRKSNLIVEASAWVLGKGMTVYKNNNIQATFNGVDESIQKIMDLEVQDGRFLTEEEVKSMAQVAVIGSKIKEDLFGDKNPLGEKIKIKQKNFEIIGVLEKKGVTAFQDQDSQIYIPVTTAQKKLLGINYIVAILANAKDENSVGEAEKDVQWIMREQHNIDNPEDDPANDDFHTGTREQATQILTQITSILSIMLSSIAAISLIVGGIGIMNIMLVSVTERTKEIGLRKAVGATNADILNQFLLESLMLTVLGGICGIILGALLSFAASIIIKSLNYTDWVFSVPLISIILGVGVAASVGLIFGLYPARKASRLNPIDALRYE